MSDPLPVVPIERVKEEVHARARNIHIMRIILDLQEQQHWTDEQAFGLMACYLADSLEMMTQKVMEATNRQIVAPVEVVRDGTTVRHAYLPNAAREMYDALVRLSGSACDGRNIPEWLREQLHDIHAAIHKAEGKS